jgi:hypothetical protein
MGIKKIYKFIIPSAKMKRGTFISKEMNKRAQFYIIAAAIISVLFVGLAATVNYAVSSQTPVKFYDIGSQYNVEASKLIDYGTYSAKTDINNTLKNFTDQFYSSASQKEPALEIVTIYGNSTMATVYSYSSNTTYVIFAQTTETIPAAQSTSTINAPDIGASKGIKQVTPFIHRFSIPLSQEQKQVKIEISDTNYTVDLSQGQNFYFVIMSRKPSGEVNVQTG